jgi:hypothetical protein
MSKHLDNIPVYELIESSVTAADYNLVHLALNRLGAPIEIPLTGLRRLELVLSRNAWIVVDHDMNDIPVLAWTDFQAEGRTALHEPVACLLKTYHMHAKVILEQVTRFMEQELAARLAALQKACEIENVTPLVTPPVNPRKKD